MKSTNFQLPENKKIYFASDFHLGAPNKQESFKREKKIVQWLSKIQNDAYAIFLVGDIFDFWFEYKHTVPKGYIRFLGKLTELVDNGINLVLFTGNHDLWMKEYLADELKVPIFHQPLTFHINQQKIYVGHGDGLGPGDYKYKMLKKIFTNKACQKLFSLIHPTIAFSFAQAWSKKSRSSQNKKETKQIIPDKEWLYHYCNKMQNREHHDVYIFGHRHRPIDLPIKNESRYINLGDWINYYSYAVFDGKTISLEYFQ